MIVNFSNAELARYKELYTYAGKPDNKLTREKLKDLFEKIDYKMEEEEFTKLCENIYGSNQTLDFEDFLKIFQVPKELDIKELKAVLSLLGQGNEQFVDLDEIN